MKLKRGSYGSSKESTAKSELVTLRVTASQKQALVEEALKSGVTLGEFLRSRIMPGKQMGQA